MKAVDSLKEKSTNKVVDLLSHFLADTYALYLETQNFHWNIEGEYFFSLHKMFEEQYQELALAVDEIAERIRALGGIAPASFSQFAALTSIKEEKSKLTAKSMLQKLLKDHEALASSALEMIAKAQHAHDEGTADMLIQRLKSHEKVAWMLRASI